MSIVSQGWVKDGLRTSKPDIGTTQYSIMMAVVAHKLFSPQPRQASGAPATEEYAVSTLVIGHFGSHNSRDILSSIARAYPFQLQGL